MIMLTNTYLLQKYLSYCLTSNVRVLFNFGLLPFTLNGLRTTIPWSLINNLLGKNSKSIVINEIGTDGNVFTDRNLIA